MISLLLQVCARADLIASPIHGEALYAGMRMDTSGSVALATNYGCPNFLAMLSHISPTFLNFCSSAKLKRILKCFSIATTSSM